MICTDCRNDEHKRCPEVARVFSSDLSEVELAASARCYCQHQPRK